MRYAVQGAHHEVRLVHPKRHHAVMHSAAAHPFARDVRSKLDGVFARGDARVGPVELARGFLVRDKVALRHPMWPCFQHHHPKTCLGQLLTKHTTGGSCANYEDVYWVVHPNSRRPTTDD